MKRYLTAITTVGVLFTFFPVLPLQSILAQSTNNSSVNLTAQQPKNQLLKNLDVTGELEDGGKFSGTLSITEFSYDEYENDDNDDKDKDDDGKEVKQLLASGVLKGTATTADGKTREISQEFEDVPANLTANSANKQSSSCDILFLDLGPIFLDVLGLTVDLSQVVLDINAVQGSGNLLGNLLCSLTGLLDGGPLGRILRLIDRINNLLG